MSTTFDPQDDAANPAVKMRNGVPLLPRRGVSVTNEIVRALLDAEDSDIENAPEISG